MIRSGDALGAIGTCRHVSGVRDVAGDYDAFLIDSYGVLHDGESPMEGAAECLDALRDQGKTVFILTNTPRRAATVASEIARVGVLARFYDLVVSAGEVTHQLLAKEGGAALGLESSDRVFYLGPPRSHELLDGLPFREVDEVSEASFVLITGLVHGRDSERHYEPLLKQALARELPAVCANPDLVAIRAGVRGACAGTIAASYEAMGGRVRSIGKPFPEIYEAALARLPASARVLCIGDALYTDIGGAQDAGLDALFIASGLHHDELLSYPSGDPHERLFSAHGRSPKFGVSRFAW